LPGQGGRDAIVRHRLAIYRQLQNLKACVKAVGIPLPVEPVETGGKLGVVALAWIEAGLHNGKPATRQFAERAAKKFSAYRVEGINFTQATKEELAYPVRVAFEERTIKVPFTNAIRADLRGVRKEVTSSEHTRFAGERNRYGHCDRFWALALALHAAKPPATGAITAETLEKIRYQKTGVVAPWRRFTPRTLQQTAGLGYFET